MWIIQGLVKMHSLIHSWPLFLLVFASLLCGFLVAQRVKPLPAVQETLVQPLGREDPLEKVMAIHSSTLFPVLLPGKSHGQRSLVGYSPWGCKDSDMTVWLHFQLSLCEVLALYSLSMLCFLKVLGKDPFLFPKISSLLFLISAICC